MTSRIYASALLLVAALAFPSFVQADVTDITDGTSQFRWDPDGSVSAILGGTGIDTDYLFAETPYLRFTVPNAAGFRPTINLGDQAIPAPNTKTVNVNSNSAVNTGNSGTQHVDVNYFDGVSGNTFDLFDVDFSFTVNSDGMGNPILDWQMAVTNVSGINYTGNMEVFSYWDFDVINFGANEGVDFSDGTFTGFEQSLTGGAAFENAFRGTDNFQNWQVASSGTLAPLIEGGGALSNSGTPFASGDMEAALGWSGFGFANGATFTINQRVYSNIPEPSTTVALVVGALGMAGVWYRRRRA